jgi:hypothetical protein
MTSNVLRRIGGINIVLGLFIWSRVVFELVQLYAHPWSGSRFFTIALTIDFATGTLSIFSGGQLLRRHPRAMLTSAIAGGAIYANALFGLFLTLPAILRRMHSIGSQVMTAASLAAHFTQSAVLMLYWTGVFLILLGDLKKRRLEGVADSDSRQTVLMCCATAASSMATVQILLRLFS